MTGRHLGLHGPPPGRQYDLVDRRGAAGSCQLGGPQVSAAHFLPRFRSRACNDKAALSAQSHHGSCRGGTVKIHTATYEANAPSEVGSVTGRLAPNAICWPLPALAQQLTSKTAGRCTVRGFRTGARWSSGTTSYSAGSGTGTASPLWLLLPLRASCEPIARHCAGSPCLQAPCHVVFVRRPTAANMSLYAHCVSTTVVGTAGLHVRSTSSRKRLGCSPKRGPRARCTAARGPPHIAVSPSFHDRDPPGCKQ